MNLISVRIDKPEPRQFIGVENYTELPGDTFFRDAAWTSVQMTVLAVLLSLVVGTGLAILLDRKFFVIKRQGANVVDDKIDQRVGACNFCLHRCQAMC